jgi:quinol monooxygenase YgiN
MITLIAKLMVKDGKVEDFINTMKAVAPKVREEPGNRAYVMHRSQDNPRLVMFYEKYTDKAAFDAHRKHLQELGVNLADLLDGRPLLEFYEEVT